MSFAWMTGFSGGERLGEYEDGVFAEDRGSFCNEVDIAFYIMATRFKYHLHMNSYSNFALVFYMLDKLALTYNLVNRDEKSQELLWHNLYEHFYQWFSGSLRVG